MATNNPIIIIGSGMAGYTLARELRKLAPDIAITLVCRDAGESYAKPTLSNALAMGKLADNIALSDASKMAESLNLTVYNFYNVSHIDSDHHTITIHPVLASDKQEILPYSKLVLATGANARTLPNVSIDQQQIFSVNHLDDYRLFQQVFHTKFKQKLIDNQPFTIAIIGAGLIGCEFANDILTHTDTQYSENILDGTLLSKNLTVTLIDKAPYPMANQLPQVAGEALQTALEQSGANFILQSDILAVENTGETSQISVKNAKGENQILTADLVLVATGLIANTELAEQAGLAVAHLSKKVEHHNTHLPRTAQQGILVNEFLQTSISDIPTADIYAIGDCANVMGSFMPYVMPLMNQAKTLAKTLADSVSDSPLATPIRYPAMPVAIKTPACPLVILPVSGRFSDDDVIWENQATDDGMILLAKEKTDSDEHLLGFVLVGKAAGKQRMTLAKMVKDWI